MSNYYFTEAGFKKIKSEVDELERFIKIDIARDLGTAAAHGDLRENAEYAAAKEKQTLSMAKLRELRQRLTNAQVVQKRDFPPETVTLCKRVKIKHVDSGDVDEYTILGDGESDIEKNIISYQSPLAAALMGHKQGEIVDAELPGGIIQYEILEIAFFD